MRDAKGSGMNAECKPRRSASCVATIGKCQQRCANQFWTNGGAPEQWSMKKSMVCLWGSFEAIKQRDLGANPLMLTRIRLDIKKGNTRLIYL